MAAAWSFYAQGLLDWVRESGNTLFPRWHVVPQAVAVLACHGPFLGVPGCYARVYCSTTFLLLSYFLL